MKIDKNKQNILIGIVIYCLLYLPTLIVFPQLRAFAIIYMGVGIFFALTRSYFLSILEKKIYLVHSMLIKYIKDEKIKTEYSEDTRAWIQRAISSRITTGKGRIISIIIAIGFGIVFIAVDIKTTLKFESLGESYTLLLGQFWYAGIFLMIAFVWLFWWVFFMYKSYYLTTNVIHHYSFWEYVPIFTRNSKERNYLGELFFLNLFLWALGIVIFGNFQIGIVLGLSGWIFSPVNPRHNYYSGMHKNYKIVAWAFMGVILLGLFLCIVRNVGDENFLFTVIINSGLVLYFIVTIIRLFILTNPVFDIKKSIPLWMKLQQRLKTDPHSFLLVVSMIPLSLAALNVYLFGDELGYLASLWVGLILLTLGFLLINFKFLVVVENTRTIALNFLDKVKSHKKIEHQFHFWETFSSPIATLFALTVGGMFFLILNRVFIHVEIELKYSIAFWGFLPTFLIVVLNGATVGALIWHTENTIHYIWHCFAITEGYTIPTPAKFYDPIRELYEVPAKKVRNACMNIFGIYIPIGAVGLTLLMDNPLLMGIILAIIYALLFPRIIKFAFGKMVPLPE